MTELQEAEKHVESLRAVIEQKDKILELFQNPIFKQFILDGFCRDEVVRLVGQSTNYNLTPEQRADSLEGAKAGGFLLNWLVAVEQQGLQAEYRLQQAIDTAEDIRNEA